MRASEKELGLSDDHGGIVILDSAEAGRRYQDQRPVRDVVFESDNKAITHRADLWGHRGVAREIACLFRRTLAPLSLDVTWGSGPAVPVDVQDATLCPRYCAVRFDGVTVGPSPLWLEWLLRAVGQRPRSNVVDLTNFVMLDLGNPIHAFDARELHGGIVVRRGHDGERIRTLDGVDRIASRDMLLIADHQRAVAIAGVMGLENSEIRADTAEVVLERLGADLGGRVELQNPISPPSRTACGATSRRTSSSTPSATPGRPTPSASSRSAAPSSRARARSRTTRAYSAWS